MKTRVASGFELALSLLRETVAHSDLLPGPYGRYRPVLADGLHFFLQRLSPTRLQALFAEQGQLSRHASTAERLVRLLRHAPALHKLGQIVARDRRLLPSFRQRLQQLESMPPALSAAEARALLDRTLPQWRRTGVRLGARPLAEGSVAVILPFTTRTSQPGVFKLLKPGIEARLHEDLEVLSALGSYLDEDCARYHLSALSYRESFDTVRDLLVHEVRLHEEQQHLNEAARFFRNVEAVAVPRLFPFCSRKVTAMERLWGTKLADAVPTRPSARQTAARHLAEALVADPLFSPRVEALFHADPHAGNLLLTREGRIGILDWSLAARLPRSEREAFVQLLLSAVQMDVGKMGSVLESLAVHAPESGALQSVLHASLRSLRWGTLPGLGWLTALLDDSVWQAGLRLPGHLMLFRKSLLTLEGVLADLLRADASTAWAVLDEVVLAGFVQHWQEELPERVFAPLGARLPRTHLAIADVLSLLWSRPFTLARTWTATALDLAQAASRVMISTTGFSTGAGASENAR